MTTILSALRDKLGADGSTIGKALGGNTVAEAISGSTITDGATTVAYVVSFNVNGGSGTVAPVACAKGSTVALPDGTGITAPSNKVFAGWGTTSSATATVKSPYAASAATTLYAVYEDEPAVTAGS